MAQKMTNQEHIEGWLYQHDLAVKTVQNQNSTNFGKEFINGTVDIATTDDGMNVIPIHFTYVTEFTTKGAKNQTFIALQKIINEGKTWLEYGKDEATCLKIDTALGLNDFYTSDDRLVSQKTNEGGFVTIISKPTEESKNRATFTFDMVITSANEVTPEENSYTDIPYLSLKGCIFNFKNEVLPFEAAVENQNGMTYFTNMEISNSNPLFTKIWGRIVSNTEVHTETEESAFGEAAVKTFERKVKKWVVTGTMKDPYEFGEEGVLTQEELIQGMQQREIKLAEVKKKRDEYQANKNNIPSPMNNGIDPVKIATFNF